MLQAIEGGAASWSEVRREQVDEFGELDRRVKEFGPVLRRHEELGRTIRSWFDSRDPAREYVARGVLYDVQLSARPNEREIFSYGSVYRILGRKRFVELATITLKLIERNIPEELHKRFMRSAPTGTRRLVPVAKRPAVNVASHEGDGLKAA